MNTLDNGGKTALQQGWPAEAATQPAVLVQSAPVAPGRKPGPTWLAGASFAGLEPGLAKEAGLTAREMPGWATAGSGVSE